MLKVILFLETAVKKPIFVLKKDLQNVINTDIGSTKLLLTESDEIFIDDITEESLLINEKTREAFNVRRIFVQSIDSYDYCNVGWILNEDMPVCGLCRTEFSPFDYKQHCKACGNICCQECSKNVTTIVGLESLGGLRVCNLCFYGQEKVSLISYRSSTRFEIRNQTELERGITSTIKVADTKNIGPPERRSILPPRDSKIPASDGIGMKKQSSENFKQFIRNKLSNKTSDSPDTTPNTNNDSISSNPTVALEDASFTVSQPVPISPSNMKNNHDNTFDHSYNLSSPKMKSKNEILQNLQPPPKIRGWLKKRGHLLLNWKTRYFVLDNGFLTYYTDAIDIPPYGKGVKGQICLAGYREKKDTTEEQRNMEVESMANKSFAESERDSSRTTATNIIYIDYTKNKMIHLEFIPGIIKEDVILYLKETTRGNTPDHSLPDNQSYELILEAPTMEEKVAWSSAFSQHTEYIETISESIKNLAEDGRLISDEFTHYGSWSAFTGSLDTRRSGGAPGQGNQRKPTIPNAYKDSAIVASYEEPSPIKNGKRSSATPSTSGKNAPSAPSNTSGKNRPLSLRQSVIHSQKFHIFLYADETMIFSGLVSKPNRMSVQKLRELVFVRTKTPDEVVDNLPFRARHGLDKDTINNTNNNANNNSNNNNAPVAQKRQSKGPLSQAGNPSTSGRLLKRLIYIDSTKYELKGDIRWIEGEPFPTIRPVGERYFEVNDQRLKKVYQFYPKDDTKVSQWIEMFMNNA